MNQPLLTLVRNDNAATGTEQSAPEKIKIEKPKAPAFAAIDVGSGKARLVIKRPNANGVLKSEREIPSQPCKLAQGMSSEKIDPVILPHNYQLARDAMKAFRVILEEENVPPQNVMAVATEAFRIIASKNPKLAEQYLADMSSDLGCGFVILTGEEEARLNAYTARMEYMKAGFHEMETDIFSIGGGSSQGAALAKKGFIKSPFSISLGAHTLKTKCKGKIAQAYRTAKRGLKKQVTNADADVLSVLGGGLRALRHILCADQADFTLRGRQLIEAKLAQAVMMTPADFAQYEAENIHNRAEELPWVIAELKARYDLTHPETLTFMSGTMSEGIVDIMHRLSTGALKAPPRGLKRPFSPSTRARAPHA